MYIFTKLKNENIEIEPFFLSSNAFNFSVSFWRIFPEDVGHFMSAITIVISIVSMNLKIFGFESHGPNISETCLWKLSKPFVVVGKLLVTQFQTDVSLAT